MSAGLPKHQAFLILEEVTATVDIRIEPVIRKYPVAACATVTETSV